MPAIDPVATATKAVCNINVSPIAKGCVKIKKIVLVIIINDKMIVISENSLFKIVTLGVIDAL